MLFQSKVLPKFLKNKQNKLNRPNLKLICCQLMFLKMNGIILKISNKKNHKRKKKKNKKISRNRLKMDQ